MKVKEESEKADLKLNIQKSKIMVPSPITLWQMDGETMDTVRDFIFLGSKITADGDCSYGIKRCWLLGRKAMINLDSILKKQRHYFANKGPHSQSYGFSSTPVWMLELYHKQSWAMKNWCFWTVVLEKTREGNGTSLQYSCLENPMDGRAWWAAVHGVAKSQTWLSDFTFTFMHWRRKWQPTPVFLHGESQGQGSLVGCRLWGRTESDTTEAT